jgi:nucleoside 2-deoxyribosyltransferase
MEPNLRVFITATYRGGKNKNEIEQLCALLRAAGFQDYCFIRDVEHYRKVFSDPSKLMQRAREEIKKSDFLLIDLTEKPTGRAIEAGIAYALGKKIIVITQRGIPLKDTVRGIAAVLIEYERLDDIVAALSSYRQKQQ